MRKFYFGTKMENQDSFGDGRLVKMEVDYAPQVDEALPKADQIAKVCFELLFLSF